MSYLWPTSSSKNITVIPWISLNSPALLKDLDMIQSKGGFVMSLVQTERHLVDFARMVLLDDTAETQVLEDSFQLFAPVDYTRDGFLGGSCCVSGDGGGGRRW